MTSMFSLDGEIRKFEEKVAARRKMSGGEFADEALAIIKTLHSALTDAVKRIDNLERKSGLGSTGSVGRSGE
ncbi:hypothetical protein [Tardiphaga sp. 862_B3_N1_1]|uniref:hypothetical protein n=1 Tax=Tardiphaga sp. 862_B3_N1_1 TaxID=3240763 RepID=UPI003F88A364